MDSLTQIVLGAAVGEVALGKKAGNRAMVLGAIGGTIPDLDVLGNFVLDDMGALAFHRGITHSFFFAFTAPLLFGWLTERFYKSGLYKNKTYRMASMLIWMFLIGLIAFGLNAIPKLITGGLNYPLLIGSIGIYVLVGLYFWWNYWIKKADETGEAISWKQWAWLFFWAIFTHPLLDSCTAFGTQLFQPFSDYRVAFNNIAVADPLYTFPFLICLIIACLITRNTKLRNIINWLGIGISSVYLLWSFYNKQQVNKVFEESFAAENIDYQRYMTSPTIFNNLLWQGVAEGDTAYYHGIYSILDDEARLQEINIFPKNYHLIAGHEKDEDIETLKWFSNNYYNISRNKDGKLYFNDLRYGSTNVSIEEGKEPNFVFRFRLEEEDGKLTAHETRGSEQDARDGDFSKFWNRMLGLKKEEKIETEFSK